MLGKFLDLTMNSLQNHILIAMPHMVDPYFGKAVVYICEHTKEGAMGLGNKPTLYGA